MFPFLSIVFGVGLLFLAYRYQRLNRLLLELNRSIGQKKPFLLDKPFGIGGMAPVDELSRSIRQLIEIDSEFSKLSADTLPQLEAALGNMQESVVIVDQANFVVMANDAAREVLSDGRNLQGKRLEQVLRSASFLDYVNAVKSGHNLGRQEIEINRGAEVLWFEVSGSPIAGLGGQPEDLTIFVLHDISRLKHLEKLRKEFVANVSHELKTPLTVIKGFSETLVEDHDQLPEEARQRFLVKILKSVQRLHLLIEDLLTLSRLESGPEKLKRMPQALPTLVKDLVENFEARLDPDLQTIKLDLDSRIHYVHVDGVRISQAFENLIDNAIRYAGEFSNINVKLELQPDAKWIHCSIQDDGVGIPQKDLPHIFERFYRVDKGRSRERGGTGLGLSIVKHIILLHGGQIFADSEPGKGTKIWFTLPAEIPDGVEVPSSKERLAVEPSFDD